jgi:eukaryotic-like serine/threonine-protein kinase
VEGHLKRLFTRLSILVLSVYTEATMATANTNRPNICFGAFELDLQLGVLRKNGSRIRCQEQPLQVLAALTEHPGELVTREELRRRVWPQDTFVDFDHALNTAIKKIRAALNDDADAPRYIETVPRRGYRFVAEVKTNGHLPAFTASAEKPHRHQPLILIIAIAVLALACVALAVRLYWHRREAVSAPEFQRVTFGHQDLDDARFTPDGASVVYSVGEHSAKAAIYVQRLSDAAPQSPAIASSILLSISRQGELAVLREGWTPSFEDSFYRPYAGTLAEGWLGSFAPRDLVEEVEAADWSPDGQLAIVRRVGDRSRLEFPIGKVLYESSGSIASPRFSPDGQKIAFLDHPLVPDDRGSVNMVDLKGATTKLSGFWVSLRGLAWSPRGNEILFTAAPSGMSRVLYAVSLEGRERRLLSIAGGLSLCDVSRDGRVLLTRDSHHHGILFMGPGMKEPRELSWRDWSIAMDISRDGKKILFGEEGEDSGFSYQVGLRPTDGSPPVILGPGIAQSLSPDGLWALSILPSPNDQILLLPTGAGTSKTLSRGPIERYAFAGAAWFPNSRQIVFAGYEPGHGSRCYVQSTDGGDPRAFTTEGVIVCSVSPSGMILGMTEDHRALLYSSASSEKPNREFTLTAGETPSGWTSDGKFLYLLESQQNPPAITRLDISSGRRQLWKQLPGPPVGSEMKPGASIVSPDGKSYAYTYFYGASDLYLVQGLR